MAKTTGLVAQRRCAHVRKILKQQNEMRSKHKNPQNVCGWDPKHHKAIAYARWSSLRRIDRVGRLDCQNRGSKQRIFWENGGSVLKSLSWHACTKLSVETGGSSSSVRSRLPSNGGR